MTDYVLEYDRMLVQSNKQQETIDPQYEAIKVLRKALIGLVEDKNDEYIPSRLWDSARQAIEATKEFV